MQISKACNNIKVSGDCLKCNVMYYLCQFLVLNYLSKMREKEPLECRRRHIWALKTQKLPGPLSGPWTPAAKGSLCSHDSASLRRQLLASEAGAPPDKILDPHLICQDSHLFSTIKLYVWNWKLKSRIESVKPIDWTHLRQYRQICHNHVSYGLSMLKGA